MKFEEIQKRAKKIKLIALDNDGVMTDGNVWVDSAGEEIKPFFIRDGFGIVMARQFGFKFAILTGANSSIVESRAKKLQIEEVHQGFMDKDEILKDILKRHRLKPEEAAFMGDDLFDIPVMKIVGFAAAPADAHLELLPHAHWASRHNGGRGAVREFIELILKACGLWEEALKKFAKY